MMEGYGLYSPLDTDKRSCREIVGFVITALFWVTLQAVISAVGTIVGVQNMNTTCDEFSLIRLSTWLFASAGLGFIALFFGMIYLVLICKRRWKVFYCNALSGIIHLVSILWSVVGLVILLSTAAGCQHSSYILWASVIGIFAGQWVGFFAFITTFFILL